MGKQRSRQYEALRRLIAVEAARLITEHGIRDFHQAKLKAAERHGLDQRSALPSNHEVEAALREQQSLFAGTDHTDHLQRLREAAVRAMENLHTFSPRLVGAVLEGTADVHSAVCLHVFVDSAEDIAIFLHDRDIAFDTDERTIRLDRERSANFPVFEFDIGGATFDLTAMPFKYLRQAPLSPSSGRPVQRASISVVRQLLSNDAEGAEGWFKSNLSPSGITA